MIDANSSHRKKNVILDTEEWLCQLMPESRMKTSEKGSIE